MELLNRAELTENHSIQVALRPQLSLLSLPIEIRLMIYQYFFASFKVYLHEHRKCKGKAKGDSFSALNLFLVNRHIYNETLPVYFSDCLLTLVRRACRLRRCFSVLKHGYLQYQMPHFHALQRVECADHEVLDLLKLEAKFKEITLNVFWERWIYLAGHPERLPVMPNAWKHLSYAKRLINKIAGQTKKVILQRDLDMRCTTPNSFRDRVLQTLPDQNQQKIIFQPQQDVVAWGIPAESQEACEKTVREMFKVASSVAMRFKGTPSN